MKVHYNQCLIGRVACGDNRPINLLRTNVWSEVTCKKCLKHRDDPVHQFNPCDFGVICGKHPVVNKTWDREETTCPECIRKR